MVHRASSTRPSYAAFARSSADALQSSGTLLCPRSEQRRYINSITNRRLIASTLLTIIITITITTTTHVHANRPHIRPILPNAAPALRTTHGTACTTVASFPLRSLLQHTTARPPSQEPPCRGWNATLRLAEYGNRAMPGWHAQERQADLG